MEKLNRQETQDILESSIAKTREFSVSTMGPGSHAKEAVAYRVIHTECSFGQLVKKTKEQLEKRQALRTVP